MRTLVQAPNSEPGDQRSDGRAAALATSPGAWLLGAPLPVMPTHRNVCALTLFLASCIVFLKALMALWAFALHDESFSHVVLIPAVSGYLLAINRATLLNSREWSPTIGFLLILLGLISYWFAGTSSPLQEPTIDRLAMTTATVVLVWWGIFVLNFGVRSVRHNLFPLGLLVLMIPFPTVMLNAVVGFLQHSSAEAAARFFTMLDIPVFRQGLVFHLSHLTIHVAEECSGIRSFLSLVIISLLAGYWFLRLGWSKASLVAFVVPLAIIKNACRIVGLALLGNYVDQTYITNSVLHRAGGIPLFALSLVVLAGLVWMLRRFEQRIG
ncbi:MAG: exosortase/archaeosortase family protein [Nitrospira sp.]